MQYLESLFRRNSMRDMLKVSSSSEQLLSPIQLVQGNLPQWVDFPEDASLSKSLPVSDRSTQLPLGTQLGKATHLKFDELNNFEVVDRQYEQWGVIFSNAIALHPSNPAFPPYSGVMLLLGAPKEGRIEATFVTPVQFVSGFVTSLHRALLLAFNHAGDLITQSESSGGSLADSSSAILANSKLTVSAPDIHRVVFQTSTGQLTLDDFTFGL
jgi:hypothetical protein